MATPPTLSDAGPLLFDILDNWLIHPAFLSFRDQVEAGYRAWFESAEYVVANSEGTLRLARDFGRSDAILCPNGCDPERFSHESLMSERFVVGYGGKIGSRLDFGLIRDCANSLPWVNFEFAGPLLDRDARRALADVANVVLLGDIRYDRYPQVLKRWDIAWVPHLVGKGEVGGDAIKIYEYRAAGLPTVTTKITGWKRVPEGVVALAGTDIAGYLAQVSSKGPGQLPRDDRPLAPEHTWRVKATHMLNLMEGSHS